MSELEQFAQRGMAAQQAVDSLPFGHSVRTDEQLVFGRTRVNLRCPLCDLLGYVEGLPAQSIREIATVMVREHYRQTEVADG